jgi:hypothetical protein
VRKVHEPDPLANSQPSTGVVHEGDDMAEAGRLVRESIDGPPLPPIPERELEPGNVRVTEIGERVLEGEDDGGTAVPVDSALLTVSIMRPTEFSWVKLFPKRKMTVPLLPYKSANESIPDHHYVIPELEAPVRTYLKQFDVYLVWDAGGAGTAYLWLVPRSPHSPYYNAVQRALALGDEFVETHLFNFGKANLKTKTCPLKQRDPKPSDPTEVLPSRPLSLLLPEALGPDKIISSTGHPVYVAIAAGRAV